MANFLLKKGGLLRWVSTILASFVLKKGTCYGGCPRYWTGIPNWTGIVKIWLVLANLVLKRELVKVGVQTFDQLLLTVGVYRLFLPISGYCPYVSTDYDSYARLFSVDEMIEVKQGLREPHSLQPYDYGLIELGIAFGHNISGADYDYVNNRLYVSIANAALAKTFTNPM